MKTAICKIEFPDNYDVDEIARWIEKDMHQIFKCIILDQPDVDEQIYQATKRNIERMSREVGGLDALRKVIVYKNHDHAEEDFRGTFLDWGLDLLEWPEGTCSFTRGIVEANSGCVHMVNPGLIRFVREKGEGWQIS